MVLLNSELYYISWKLSKQLKKKDKEYSENKEAVSRRFIFSVIKYEFACVAVQAFRSIVIILGSRGSTPTDSLFSWILGLQQRDKAAMFTDKNIRVFFLFGRICLKKKSSQCGETPVLFLSTNIAAIKSAANQQLYIPLIVFKLFFINF